MTGEPAPARTRTNVMRLIAASLAMVSMAWAADVDVNSLVRNALSREIDRQRRLENYTWEQLSTEKTLDGKGKIVSTRVKVHEHLMIDGSEYRRLVEEDGQPLSPDRVRQEQEKMDREIARRKNESPGQRRDRLAEHEKRREEGIKFREEMLQAFQFTVAGEDKLKGVDCWRVQGEPNRDFKSKTREGKLLLGKIRGTMWISKQGGDLIKVDAETVEKITFGGFLASVSPGAHIKLEMMQVNAELWHPESIRIGISARALLKHISVEEEIAFRNFRKFQAESKMVAAGDEKP